jgi:CheY-like chemotaxis protein
MRHVVALLESLGLNVTIATTTEQALEEVNARPFDLVVSDMRRDGDAIAGLTLLKSMRDAGIRTPLIFTVGRYEPDRGVPAGAFGITNRVDELLNLVFDALERTRGWTSHLAETKHG